MNTPNSDQIRVLLCDDDANILRSLKRVLVESGLEVETSSCAAEANAVLNHFSIDAIVCDHNMPGRTGLEFLTEIRKTKPDLITMMLSGEVKGIKVAEDWANEIGLHALFSKPFDGHEIAATIRAEVMARNAAAEAAAAEAEQKAREIAAAEA